MRNGIVQEIAYAPYITPEPFSLEKEAIDASKTAFFFRKVVLILEPLGTVPYGTYTSGLLSLYIFDFFLQTCTN